MVSICKTWNPEDQGIANLHFSRGNFHVQISNLYDHAIFEKFIAFP